MYFNLSNENKNKSGVYRITNIKNNRVYIGSTIQTFEERYYEHVKSLRKNKHSNKFLQRDFNLHKEEDYIFKLTEIVLGTESEIRGREQVYLDLYYDAANKCYNLNKFAISKGPWSNNPDQTKAKISKSVKAYYANNPDAREKILTRSKSESHIKQFLENSFTPEAKAKRIKNTYFIHDCICIFLFNLW